MAYIQPVLFPVTEETQVFEARRVAVALAQGEDWSEQAAGKLAIIVTEIGTNLVKHAVSGEIHLSLRADGTQNAIEVLAIDRGPGVSNIDARQEDGFSTAGTAGTGLGAIERLADEFDVYSQVGKGTCLVARLHRNTYKALPSSRLRVGSVQVAVKGERECGDSWGVRRTERNLTFVLADGLGHGPDAAEASREAVAVLANEVDSGPVALLEQIHKALHSTRGAAVAAAQIDLSKNEVRFCGVGNISAMIIRHTRTQGLISHNGTAGQNVRRFQEFLYAWEPEAVLVMHSDGLTTSWNMDAYPGITSHHPALIAGTLLRDASRGRDDCCVIVAGGGG